MKKFIEIAGSFKNFYLVEKVGPKEIPNISDSGIVVPTGEKSRNIWFRIRAVGPEAKTEYADVNGEKHNAKIGDLMIYAQGINVYLDLKEYVSVADTNVLVIVPGDKL